MKRRYENPVIEALEVRSEDIMTLSYMLPEMPIEENSDENVSGQAN